MMRLPVYVRALSPMYCKFGNFPENFIFANSGKRHICDVKIVRLGMIYLYQ